MVVVVHPLVSKGEGTSNADLGDNCHFPSDFLMAVQRVTDAQPSRSWFPPKFPQDSLR